MKINIKKEQSHLMYEHQTNHKHISYKEGNERFLRENIERYEQNELWIQQMQE
jgi:hypothetical protein